MLPRFWMDSRRLTMTFLADMRRAPRARVTETTMGRSSGVRPTARATAKRKDSSQGRWKKALASSTKSTRRIVMRMIRMPNFWVPSWKEVAGGRVASVSAISPRAVPWPVLHTSTLPVPLMTEVPMSTEFPARRPSACPGSSPGAFSTG